MSVSGYLKEAGLLASTFIYPLFLHGCERCHCGSARSETVLVIWQDPLYFCRYNTIRQKVYEKIKILKILFGKRIKQVLFENPRKRLSQLLQYLKFPGSNHDRDKILIELGSLQIKIYTTPYYFDVIIINYNQVQFTSLSQICLKLRDLASVLIFRHSASISFFSFFLLPPCKSTEKL